MCDCYECKCEVCGQELPVHLGDYETNRDEIECFCRLHIPEKDCRIFTMQRRHNKYQKGWQMAIRALTDNARKNVDLNGPNIGVDFEEVDV